ncbi:cyanophycinase [Leptolyngbya sp. 7M]|uniref:cyanophycinase n=1 Tax=Leptolyngbya sp. 7M TaxID=2812896 RepID=UPI001B8C4C0C|nr:cyanophycinase [Leptolyngbya sp. 7M]QYO62421.1 cyanophycinase [Leptolyngbya sp. 7M]
MGTDTARGPLVIIGDAEDRDGECIVLREFLRLAGGLQARIAVMTAATSMPKEVGDDYIRIFKRLGADSVETVHTEDREDSRREDSLRIIEQATGIFFTGGDQSRIVDFIRGTPLDQAIHRRHEEGVVIGGTSAGAAMMPDEMTAAEAEAEATQKEASQSDS